MGWRNWNFYQGEITQEIMEANMHAMVDATRTPLGHSKPASLLELGYTRAGLDDNWQACGTGVDGSFHAADGTPLINLTRFPSMKSMVATGHSLGLKVGCAASGPALPRALTYSPKPVGKPLTLWCVVDQQLL